MLDKKICRYHKKNSYLPEFWNQWFWEVHWLTPGHFSCVRILVIPLSYQWVCGENRRFRPRFCTSSDRLQNADASPKIFFKIIIIPFIKLRTKIFGKYLPLFSWCIIFHSRRVLIRFGWRPNHLNFQISWRHWRSRDQFLKHSSPNRTKIWWGKSFPNFRLSELKNFRLKYFIEEILSQILVVNIPENSFSSLSSGSFSGKSSETSLRSICSSCSDVGWRVES